MSFGKNDGVDIFAFYVPISFRTWNHLCWTFEGSENKTTFYFNGEKIGEKQTSSGYMLHGSPDHDNFLLIGQEPDSWQAIVSLSYK